jgi:hypothetical protein
MGLFYQFKVAPTPTIGLIAPSSAMPHLAATTIPTRIASRARRVRRIGAIQKICGRARSSGTLIAMMWSLHAPPEKAGEDENGNHLQGE